MTRSRQRMLYKVPLLYANKVQTTLFADRSESSSGRLYYKKEKTG